MGYNTVVLVLNDGLEEIRRNPSFGQSLVNAILHHTALGGITDVDGHLTRVKVVSQEHADLMQVLAIGGNTAIKLGHAGWRDPIHTILHRIANEHGFRLVRDQQFMERAKRSGHCEACNKEKPCPPRKKRKTRTTSR